MGRTRLSLWVIIAAAVMEACDAVWLDQSAWTGGEVEKLTPCVNDPTGILADDGSTCALELGPENGGHGGYECDYYDGDYNGYAVYFWQLCPDTCGKCDVYQAPVCHAYDARDWCCGSATPAVVVSPAGRVDAHASGVLLLVAATVASVVFN